MSLALPVPIAISGAVLTDGRRSDHGRQARRALAAVLSLMLEQSPNRKG